MSAVSDGIPHVCAQFLKHVPCVHKTAVFVTIHYRYLILLFIYTK